jgi:hypothetical protein
MQATITNSGWIISRNKFGQYSYTKVDTKRMGSVSETRDYGFVLTVTSLVTGKTYKVWKIATLEDAKNIYQNS